MNRTIRGLFIGPFFIFLVFMSCSSSTTKYEESFRGKVKTMLIEHRLKKGNRNVIFHGRSGSYKSNLETYGCLENSMKNNVEVSITLFPGTFQIKDCRHD
jgi:hypothetical protein